MSFGVAEDHPPRQILTHHNFVPFRTVFSRRPGIRDQKALRCRKNQTAECFAPSLRDRKAGGAERTRDVKRAGAV